MTVVDRPDAQGGRGRLGPKIPVSGRRPSSEEGKLLTIVAPQVSMKQQITSIWRYRELLWDMTRKALRVQYKDSILGILWSLLNPAVSLLVYFVVFQKILGSRVPRFAIFLMCGVLVWNFFSTAVTTACGSVVVNAQIIKKVAFPREVPVLATIGSALLQMGLQSIVLVGFLVAFWRGPAVEYLPLLIPALVAVVLLASALGLLFAAINVRFRDMNHLLVVAMNVWFWAVPIVYQYRLIRDSVFRNHHNLEWLFYLYRCNPITPIVLTFQRAIYTTTSYTVQGKSVGILPDHAGPWWYLWQLLVVIAFALTMFAVALRVFAKAEGNFAEDL
ncbi:MAG: ABC transporter permease [Actinomycetota bacterium]|nr:ABC transporter permease [Actinomycetota bacterium]